MLDRIWTFFKGDHRPPTDPVLDSREHRVVETLARVSGKTVEQVRNEQRRRALSIEVESVRRHR